jgi:hypothetical protein
MYDTDQFVYCGRSVLKMLKLEETLSKDQNIKATEMLVNARMCRPDRGYLKFCNQSHLVLEVRTDYERNKKITEGERLLSDTHNVEKEIQYLE